MWDWKNCGISRGIYVSKRKIIISVILIILIGVAFAAYKAKTPKPAAAMPTVEVKKGDISSKIIAVGTIDASKKQEVYSGVSGIVEFAAEEGQHVKKGDLILQLDDTDVKSEAQQAEASLMRQQAELSQILDGPRPEELEKARIKEQQAALKYERAAADYDKAKSLYESGAITLEELEDAEKDLDDSRSELDTARLELKIMSNPDPYDVDMKKALVKEEEAKLLQSRKKLESTKVYAGFDGIVTNSSVKPGMAVSQGDPAMTVLDTKDLEVSLKVSEYDAARLEIGQNASIAGDGLGEKEYEGRVAKIAPVASTVETGRGSQTTVKVVLKVLNPDEDIKPGYSANVEIIVAEKKQVLMLPLESVITEEDGKKVMVVKDGNPVKQKIGTGIYNELYIEITSGLSEGEKVLQNPSLGKA